MCSLQIFKAQQQQLGSGTNDQSSAPIAQPGLDQEPSIPAATLGVGPVQNEAVAAAAGVAAAAQATRRATTRVALPRQRAAMGSMQAGDSIIMPPPPAHEPRRKRSLAGSSTIPVQGQKPAFPNKARSKPKPKRGKVEDSPKAKPKRTTAYNISQEVAYQDLYAKLGGKEAIASNLRVNYQISTKVQ